MSVMSKPMKVGQNLNVWEISFFKLYLVTVTFILSIWFPVLLTGDLWLYIVTSVILLILTFSFLIKQQGNFYKTIFSEWFWIKIFKKASIYNIGIFKLTMMSFALLMAKLFPVLLTAHIAWYIAIACVFIWYYFNLLFCSK